jgi:hypothetical protein
LREREEAAFETLALESKKKRARVFTLANFQAYVRRSRREQFSRPLFPHTLKFHCVKIAATDRADAHEKCYLCAHPSDFYLQTGNVFAHICFDDEKFVTQPLYKKVKSALQTY